MHKGVKAICKKVLAGSLTALLMATSCRFPSVTVTADAAGNYDYGDALAKALLFYQLQVVAPV